MPKERKHIAKQTAIREMLKDLGHNVELRSEPQPSVFLDHEPEARFFGPDWLKVFALVSSYHKTKPSNV